MCVNDKPGAQVKAMPPTGQHQHRSAMPVTSLAELSGAWSSDCGLMLIAHGEVRDNSGETARLALTPNGQLEMQFAGELWRSSYLDRDHIHWEGDGGVWARASGALDAEPPPQQRDLPMPMPTHAMPPQASPHPGCFEAPGFPCSSPCLGPCPCPCPCPFAGPAPQSAPCLGHPLMGMQPPGASFGLGMGPASCGLGAGMPLGLGGNQPPWLRPPFSTATISQPSQMASLGSASTPNGSPQLALLEAKVDYLTSAVLDLQGELVRMMQVRRAGAQRRAMAEELAERIPPLFPPAPMGQGYPVNDCPAPGVPFPAGQPACPAAPAPWQFPPDSAPWQLPPERWGAAR